MNGNSRGTSHEQKESKGRRSVFTPRGSQVRTLPHPPFASMIYSVSRHLFCRLPLGYSPRLRAPARESVDGAPHEARVVMRVGAREDLLSLVYEARRF